MSRPAAGPAATPRWVAIEALPAVLRNVSHPPAGLWLLGAEAALRGAPDRHIAIVGTREATPYGIRVASDLAAACARAGLVVVSGLARGIDAAAHRAALDAGGETIAVQGTGVDVPYPVSHRALHAVLAQRATVVSEVEPGTAAFRGCFPRRNRLIAALSKIVVVVEADHKSGAINTATHALELNGTVAAVPGRTDAAQSNGTNQLLFDGAQMIRSPADLLTLAGVTIESHWVSRSADSQEGTAGESDGAGHGSVADTSPDERNGEGFADFARRMLAADLARFR
ncbi:MAG: DNA-protecting protein DprA [Gemmatimonadetes bacterium]|nr:DNA-protecting protein DprA [Gemmatimonadota bacterium]